MKKIDNRKLGKEAQQQLRYLSIKLYKKGMSSITASDFLGVHSSSVRKWWKIYKLQGIKGLTIKKRGVKEGFNRKLSQEQTKILKETILNKTPDEIDLKFSLWTRRVIKFAILRLFNIIMPIRTVGLYMHRFGFTPQKPIRRAYQQNKKLVKKWIEEDYPNIKKKAKEEKAEIHWLDETGLKSNDYRGKSYSPKGKTPVIRVDARRINMNLISTITNNGKIRFMTYPENMNSKILIKFIRKLVYKKERKVFIILDNLSVHHSKHFKAWLKDKKEKIEVFYLPPYSPELNPDEYLNRDLKSNFYRNYFGRNKKLFKKNITSFMKKLQNTKNGAKKYFKNNNAKYAA